MIRQVVIRLGRPHLTECRLDLAANVTAAISVFRVGTGEIGDYTSTNKLNGLRK